MKASNNEDGRRANKIAAKTQAKSEVSTKKVRFCMYHLQGVCKYTDETCAFAHSTEEITASRRGKRAGQAGPAQPPPARGHAAPGHLGAPPPPESLGKRRGVGAQQPAMSDPMKVGARGRRQDLAWLPASEWPTPYIEQVQFPDARGQIAMDMLQREYSQRLGGFHPPPPGIPYADTRADQSLGDLQRSIVKLSQAIKHLAVQPCALQDPAKAAPLGAEPYGLPNGGRGGAPRARFEDAGEGDVDKFAPRKVTVSPQSWVSGGLGGVSLLGGDGMTAQDVYGQPPPAEWLPPASFRRH